MLSEFHFLRPLWLLALVPLALLLWQRLRANGDADIWRRVVDPHLLPRLLRVESSGSARLPLILLASGWLLLVTALAGPTWQRLPSALYQAQQFRVIALDLSPSMHATDLKPSRLARARFELLDLLSAIGDGQTAVIAYGAEPYIVSPLTGDAATIAAQVPLLDTALLPQIGEPRTDLALAQAADLLRQAGAKKGDVILITDTVRPADSSQAAAQDLRGAGHRVSVLAVGTASGAPVRLPDGSVLKASDGTTVIPRLDADALAAVATAGGGRYVPAVVGDDDIGVLLSQRFALPADAAEKQDATTERWREEGPWLLLLLLPLAALAFRRGWFSPLPLLFVFVLPPPNAHAGVWDDFWWRKDQQAMHRLESGAVEQATVMFERQDWRAAAAYQSGDYATALESLDGIEGGRAAYNRGNSLARLGRLEDAVTAYDDALRIDPDDADARFNRDLVQSLLDAQRAQQREERERQRKQEQEKQARDDASDSTDQSESGEAEQQSEPSEQDQAQGGESDAEQQSNSQQDASSDSTDQSESGEAEQQSVQGEPSEQDQAKGGESDAQQQSRSEQNASDDSTDQSEGGEAEQQSEQGEPSEQDQAKGDESDAEQQSSSQQAQRADSSDTQQRTDEQGGDTESNDGQAQTAEGNQSKQGSRSHADQAAAGEQHNDDSEQQAAGQLPDGQPADPSEQPDEAGDQAQQQTADTGEPQAAEEQTADADQAQSAEQDTEGSESNQAEQAAREGEQGQSGRQAAIDTQDAGAEQDRQQAEAGRLADNAEQTPPSLSEGQRDQQGEEQAGDASNQLTQRADETSQPVDQSRGMLPTQRPSMQDLLSARQRQEMLAQRRDRESRLAGDGDEDTQALEQMLRQVEDDPGGLLRQRFLLQHLQRQGRLPK